MIDNIPDLEAQLANMKTEPYGYPELNPADPPSDQLILELFRLLSKELEQKNALIKDLIRALQQKPPRNMQAPEESGANLSDLITLAQPILTALTQKQQQQLEHNE